MTYYSEPANLQFILIATVNGHDYKDPIVTGSAESIARRAQQIEEEIAENFGEIVEATNDPA